MELFSLHCLQVLQVPPTPKRHEHQAEWRESNLAVGLSVSVNVTGLMVCMWACDELDVSVFTLRQLGLAAAAPRP